MIQHTRARVVKVEAREEVIEIDPGVLARVLPAVVGESPDARGAIPPTGDAGEKA